MSSYHKKSHEPQPRSKLSFYLSDFFFICSKPKPPMAREPSQNQNNHPKIPTLTWLREKVGRGDWECEREGDIDRERKTTSRCQRGFGWWIGLEPPSFGFPRESESWRNRVFGFFGVFEFLGFLKQSSFWVWSHWVFGFLGESKNNSLNGGNEVG